MHLPDAHRRWNSAYFVQRYQQVVDIEGRVLDPLCHYGTSKLLPPPYETHPALFVVVGHPRAKLQSKHTRDVVERLRRDQASGSFLRPLPGGKDPLSIDIRNILVASIGPVHVETRGNLPKGTGDVARAKVACIPVVFGH